MGTNRREFLRKAAGVVALAGAGLPATAVAEARTPRVRGDEWAGQSLLLVRAGMGELAYGDVARAAGVLEDLFRGAFAWRLSCEGYRGPDPLSPGVLAVALDATEHHVGQLCTPRVVTNRDEVFDYPVPAVLTFLYPHVDHPVPAVPTFLYPHVIPVGSQAVTNRLCGGKALDRLTHAFLQFAHDLAEAVHNRPGLLLLGEPGLYVKREAFLVEMFAWTTLVTARPAQ